MGVCLKNRTESGWNRATTHVLQQVQETLDAMREYWPLTLRQLYYRLVGAQAIENNKAEYVRLSRIVSKARLQGAVAWEAIEDRSRSQRNYEREACADNFVEWHTKAFLDPEGYRRDLLQTQPAALEIWCEKDALAELCGRACDPYGVPVVVARGFSSVSYVHELRTRIYREWEVNERPTKLLYFGDFDPSGLAILPSITDILLTEMNVPEDWFSTERIALQLEQVQEYHLPYSPDAIKKHDPRAAAFVSKYGLIAVELDAIEPEVFLDIVKTAILDNLDADNFSAEMQKQKDDRRRISALRDKVQDLFRSQRVFDGQ